MICTIQYGSGTLELDVPRARVAGVMAPRPAQAVPDVGKAVRSAVAMPVAARPLEELLQDKRTALLVTVDNTRPSPAPLLLPLIDLCKRQNVKPTVIIANGRHRAMTDAELHAHLGEGIMETCAVLQHDAFDDACMVSSGVTRRGTPIRVNKIIFEYDVVIGAGIIEPSYLCGWSGGRKLLMPGLAWHESIDSNHFFLTHPDARIGRLHGNPVSDDAAEFAAGLPLHFIVYAVSGPNDEVTQVIAGDPIEAHAKACAVAESIYRVDRLEADIVISSAGGAPYDCDLVQGKKAIIPAAQVVRRNGVVIICAECPNGLGAEKTFTDWILGKTPHEVTRDVLDRKQFSLGSHGANILAKPIVEKNATVILVTRPEVARRLRGGYLVCLTSLAEAWQLANLLTGTSSRVLFIEKARRLIVADKESR